MAASRNLTSDDAKKTYRYLRIGMVGTVVMLAAAIMFERVKAGCLQDSISAYYYTPARGIFVGGMVAIGFALIVIKGRNSIEDVLLNCAGMLAPVVAIAPTMDVGACWSVPPTPRPFVHGALAPWVVANVRNNFDALLIAGAFGLIVAFLIGTVVNRGLSSTIEKVERGTRLSLAATAAALLLGWVLIEFWGDFFTKAHGFSAVGMFGLLAAAVVLRAVEHRRESPASWYFRLYAAVAAVMVIGGPVLWALKVGGAHRILVVEAVEIAAFAAFWLVQTWEHWDDEPAAATTT